MRAAVVPRAGARWEVREVPLPEPGPNQVLIRVRACGLCHTDLHAAHGILPVELPRTLGHEVAGEVVAIGPGVTARRAGDRVGVAWHQGACGRCDGCRRGQEELCLDRVATGIRTQGGHAEHMLAAAAATFLLPDGLADEQAAPILCAGYTAWSGLRAAHPQPGERVAVVGIGGLGHLAVQYARAAGFETLAVTRSADKEPLLRRLGAEEVVADGRGLLAAGGADVLLATGSSYRAVTDALQGLRPDGRLVVLGFSAEPLALGADLPLRRWHILGATQGGPQLLYEALDWAARGKVKAMIETYPLDKISRACERLAAGRVRFRAVILP